MQSITGLNVAESLQALRTVGDVGASVVTPQELEQTLHITVDFGLSTALEPFNWGSLPLLVVNTSGVQGLINGSCDVERAVDFVYKVSSPHLRGTLEIRMQQ